MAKQLEQFYTLAVVKKKTTNIRMHLFLRTTVGEQTIARMSCDAFYSQTVARNAILRMPTLSDIKVRLMNSGLVSAAA